MTDEHPPTTPTVELPAEPECEYGGCTNTPRLAHVVTGGHGTDGVAVYCNGHHETMVDRPGHTLLTDAEVTL